MANSGSGLLCVACQCENGGQRRFCRQCGQGLIAACNACQFPNGKADLFCGGCGTGLSAAVQEPSRSTEGKSPAVGTPRPAQQAPPNLAGRLASLNSKKVKARRISPPPPPKATKDAGDEIGQEQIDAIFG